MARGSNLLRWSVIMATRLHLLALSCSLALGVLDPRVSPSGRDRADDRGLALKEAEADHLRARLALLDAEIALARYDRAYEQEVASLEREITLAEVDRNVLGPDARGLEVQLAEIKAANARMKLQVLRHHTRGKRLDEIEGAIEKARKDEAVKGAAYERAKVGRSG